MAEQVDLAAPVNYANQTYWKLDRLTIDISPPLIRVQLVGTNGEAASKVYDSTTTPTAATLLSNLNKANFSGVNNSLVKTIFNRLVADGVIAGSVSGTPS